jgi:hypothetical protein
MAISLCELFGVQMSTASTSFRSITFRQSVSTDSYPPLLANALRVALVAPAHDLQPGWSLTSKKFETFGTRWSASGP